MFLCFSAAASNTAFTSAAWAGSVISLPCINLFLINVAVGPIPYVLNVESSIVAGSCSTVTGVGLARTTGSAIFSSGAVDVGTG